MLISIQKKPPVAMAPDSSSEGLVSDYVSSAQLAGGVAAAISKAKKNTTNRKQMRLFSTIQQHG